MNDEIVPKPGWVVHLGGDEHDLRQWEQLLKPQFSPSCERIPHDGHFIRVLRHHSFDGLSTPVEVRDRATPLLEWLNGALGVEGDAGPVSLKSIGLIDNDGKIGLTTLAEGKSIGIGRLSAVGIAELRDASGNLIPPSPAAAVFVTKMGQSC
jgi:hypothetical protein